MSTLLNGCSNAPSVRVNAFEDSATTAQAAVTALDSDGDGALSVEELASAPGLQSGRQRIDTDRDDQLSTEEIRARFEMLANGSDLIGISLRITDNGRPVPDADITLLPDEFLGTDLQSYRGKTDSNGNATLSGEQVQLPGIPTGYYTVRVLSASTGTDATLGCEIADDASGSRLTLDVERGASSRTSAPRR